MYRCGASFRTTVLTGVQGRVGEWIQVINYPCRILFRIVVQLGLGDVVLLRMRFLQLGVGGFYLGFARWVNMNA